MLFLQSSIGNIKNMKYSTYFYYYFFILSVVSEKRLRTIVYRHDHSVKSDHQSRPPRRWIGWKQIDRTSGLVDCSLLSLLCTLLLFKNGSNSCDGRSIPSVSVNERIYSTHFATVVNTPSSSLKKKIRKMESLRSFEHSSNKPKTSFLIEDILFHRPKVLLKILH